MSYIICDIDGTVADLSHRVHWVRTKPKNWKAFNIGIANDKPIKEVLEVIKMLSVNGYEVVFCSGRSHGGSNYHTTTQWLNAHFNGEYTLYMREANDFRKDSIVKEELLDRIIEHKGSNPFCVFDDRPQVIEMWKKRGVFVFDVANGKWDGIE